MENLKAHFLELQQLFEGYKPIFPTLRFDITGDNAHFTLKKELGYPNLYAGLFVLLFVIPFFIMIPSNVKNFRFWVTGLLMIGLACIIFRFLVASRSIVVDTVAKILVLEKRNIFKKCISKPVQIPFHGFQELVSEPISKTINKFGQKVVYHRIYIRYKDQKVFVFELPQTLSPEIFKECLEAILKKE